jgi:peptidoglycan-N-acetylglucosamine deacetylase
MTNELQAAISSDIDTLSSIYKGKGCRRPGGYTFAELKIGLENFSCFLEPYGIKATLFMVGNDFKHNPSHQVIKSIAGEGHEIANHTLTHAQGFRFLTPAEKEAEIAGMEELCKEVTGKKPVGFRAPGWNLGDDTLKILQKRGYTYDSSVHPTTLMPLLKLLHWRAMSGCSKEERTTMGHMKYIFAPIGPYRTASTGFSKKGNEGIIEFPLTVTPLLRLPFFATFLLASGLDVFKWSYKRLKSMKYPIQFQFHLSDFVDYSHPDLADQVPSGSGLYVPQALNVSLGKKMAIFKQAMDIMAEDYMFVTLAEWANRIGVDQNV